MNIPQMAAQARDHWKETNPEIYQKMVKNHALEEESEAVAKLTMREMDALMLLKMTEQEAWEASRTLFIFRTAKQLAQDYRPEEDEEEEEEEPTLTSLQLKTLQQGLTQIHDYSPDN